MLLAAGRSLGGATVAGARLLTCAVPPPSRAPPHARRHLPETCENKCKGKQVCLENISDPQRLAQLFTNYTGEPLISRALHMSAAPLAPTTAKHRRRCQAPLPCPAPPCPSHACPHTPAFCCCPSPLPQSSRSCATPGRGRCPAGTTSTSERGGAGGCVGRRLGPLLLLPMPLALLLAPRSPLNLPPSHPLRRYGINPPCQDSFETWAQLPSRYGAKCLGM